MDTVNSSKEFHHIQFLLLWHIAKTLQPQTKGELAQGTCMEHIWNGIGNPSSQETPKQDRNKGSQQWVAHGQHTVVSTYQVWAPDVPNLKRTKCNMCEPGSYWRWEMDRIKVNSWNFDEKKFMNAHSPRVLTFSSTPGVRSNIRRFWILALLGMESHPADISAHHLYQVCFSTPGCMVHYCIPSVTHMHHANNAVVQVQHGPKQLNQITIWSLFLHIDENASGTSWDHIPENSRGQNAPTLIKREAMDPKILDQMYLLRFCSWCGMSFRMSARSVLSTQARSKAARRPLAGPSYSDWNLGWWEEFAMDQTATGLNQI